MQYAITRGVPASRLYFLPNVVDTEWFKPPDSFSKEPLTLIAVGRLVKRSGWIGSFRYLPVCGWLMV